MYCVEENKEINKILNIFHHLGLWQSGEEPTVKDMILKLFYVMYYILFPISLIWGAISNDKAEEAIFLVNVAIAASVLSLKLCYVVAKKEDTCDLLNGICDHSYDDYDDVNLVNNKLKRVRKYVKVFLSFTFLANLFSAFIVPFLGTERTLFFKIGFPLDWKNNEIAFWIAFTFVSFEAVLSWVPVAFSMITWYIMINCSLKYEILGNQIMRMGVIRPTVELREATGSKRKLSELEKQNIFLGDLMEAIKSYNHIRDLINQMESFFSIIFVVQLATSGTCICTSIYSLVFVNLSNFFVYYLSFIVNIIYQNHGDNIITEHIIYVGVLIYNIFEIFMVMYLGNEITLSNDSLSYCLFESSWTDQPQPTKKCIIIFGEMLKKPHILLICKLYPLTLETFTRILRSAYDMFNILQNLNHR